MSYRLFLLLAIPVILFTAKGNAQKAYVGLGISLLTKDKIYFDSDYINKTVLCRATSWRDSNFK